MKMPEVNFKIKFCLFTSGVAVLFRDDSKVQFPDASQVIDEGFMILKMKKNV